MKAEQIEYLHKIFPEITQDQISKLKKYVELIVDQNRRVNLISRNDVPRIWEHHIFPSLVALKVIRITPGSALMDFGSGPGLPGIPIKILRNDLNVILVDSIRKKALFLRKVIEDLNLSDAVTLNSRLNKSNYPSYFENGFDLITARAVDSIENLYPTLQPLLKTGGNILAWKGQTDIPELEVTSRKYDFSFEIIQPPQDLIGFSKRIDGLRLFKLKPPQINFN